MVRVVGPSHTGCRITTLPLALPDFRILVSLVDLDVVGFLTVANVGEPCVTRRPGGGVCRTRTFRYAVFNAAIVLVCRCLAHIAAVVSAFVAPRMGFYLTEIVGSG